MATDEKLTMGQDQMSILLSQLAGELKEARAALRWYADEAEAIAKHLQEKRDTALLASVQVLALDAGKRARDAGA